MIDAINQIVLSKGLIALFFITALNGLVGFPPSEITFLFAGMLAYFSNYSLLQTLSIGILGNLIGAYTLFLIGRFFGHKWIFSLGFVNKKIKESSVKKLEKKFHKEGAYWVGIFRCLPIGRSVVSLPAGMIHMHHASFLIYSTIGIAVWALFWQLLGFYMGLSFLKYKLYASIILVSALFIVLLFFRSKVKQYLEHS